MFSHTCHKNVSVYFNLILSQGRKCCGVVSLQPGVVMLYDIILGVWPVSPVMKSQG